MQRLYTASLMVLTSTLLLAQGAHQPEATMGAATAQIAHPPPGYRFPSGQSLFYSVEWHLFNAGTATVRTEQAGAEQRVTLAADSTGFVNALYKVHDRFEAYVDPRTFCSLRVSKHTEEGFRKRDTQIRFDYAQRKSILDEKNLKTSDLKHELNDIPGCVTDVVSGFFYLTSLRLEPGDIHRFPINDGKTTEVNARVEAREAVKVPAGTFQTVRVKAEAYSGPLKGKGAVWVWYTDDANHTPVQMRSKLGWGTLLLRLQRMEKQ